MQNEIDPSLLKIIHLLVSTGSVTATAQQMNLSPGSISYALKKARSLTGRHLFIRSHSGMKPDAMALELSQRYQRFTGSAQENNSAEAVKQLDSMTIRSHALMEMKLAERLATKQYEYQPVRHRFVPPLASPAERIAELKSFAVDMDLGDRLPHDPLINQIKMLTCRASVLVSQDSPLEGPAITLEQWYAAKHATCSSLVSYYCDSVVKSRAALKHLENRQVVMVSSSNINKVAYCASHDCMMLVPDFYVPVIRSTFPVKRLGLPPELDLKYDSHMHIHSQLTDDEAMMAKIDQVIVEFKKLAATEFARDDGVLFLES
ncbi:LysR family transcriptional regulator [Enterobacteriaceae bacterium 89]|nr:LysR family transcriptional regulator [Enterobacteriaceae bacterium 89]